MKRIALGLCLAAVSTTLLLGLAAEVGAGAQWLRTLGRSGAAPYDELDAGVATSDGGFAFAGYYDLGTSSDGWVVKLNASGDTEWQRRFGLADEDEVIYDIQQTSDGGYIATGYSNVSDEDRVWCLKLDSAGNEVWNKRYGGSCRGEGKAVRQVGDGGYIVAGWVILEGADNFDIGYLRLDANGVPLWAVVYGGSKDEWASDVDLTADGGFIIAGSTYSFGSGSYARGFCLKANAAGTVTWMKIYGGGLSESFNFVRSAADGGFLVGGRSNSYGSHDAWCLKLTSTGTISWQTVYSGSWDALGAVATVDGNWVIGGTTYDGNYRAWFAKIGKGGSIIWQKKSTLGGYSSAEAFLSVDRAGKSGYYLGGRSFPADSDIDAQVMRTNLFGSIDSGCGPLLDADAGYTATTSLAVSAVLTLKTPPSGVTSLSTGAAAEAPNYLLCSSPIVISPASLPGAQFGIPYSIALSSAGGVAPYVYQIESGSLPPGIGLAANLISGTPTAGGSYSFTLRSTDADGYTATVDFIIHVSTGPCPSITLLPAALPQAVLNEVYSTSLDAAGGTAPYTYSLTSGTLPHGLSLSIAGSFSGAPAETGSFPIEITATDATGCTGMQSYALVAAMTCAGCPEISSIRPGSGKPGSSATIRGAGFDKSAANNVVYFGARKARVTRARTTSLKVTVPRKLKKGQIVGVYVLVAKNKKSNSVSFEVK
ncbi:MAG: putative Ig domain-containing protein [Acidobacteriota bacterium]